MRLLLDTHVLIWWESDPDQLSTRAADALTDTDNTLLLSLVSLWEMQIKIGLGKMTLSGSLPNVVARQQSENQLTLLPITTAHIYALENLDDHHRDPFDRLLVAQASQDDLTLVTADPKVQAYDVNTLW
jgi:PIN domain nuclease of toxin-antitoxin system